MPGLAGDSGGQPGCEPGADESDEHGCRRSDDAPVAGLDPALATTPISNGVGLPAPGEVPISTPIGLEPPASYPILGGDPGLGLGSMPAAASTGSGGLVGEISSALQNLGAGQAIDLLKGTVMPMITSAMKAPAAVPPPPARCLRHRPPTDRPVP